MTTDLLSLQTVIKVEYRVRCSYADANVLYNDILLKTRGISTAETVGVLDFSRKVLSRKIFPFPNISCYLARARPHKARIGVESCVKKPDADGRATRNVSLDERKSMSGVTHFVFVCLCKNSPSPNAADRCRGLRIKRSAVYYRTNSI